MNALSVLDSMAPALKDKIEPEWNPRDGICFARVDNHTGRPIFTDKPQSFFAPFRCGDEPKSEAAGTGLDLDEAQRRGGI